MFYAGIYLQKSSKAAAISIIEKDLTSAKKRYNLCEVVYLPENATPEAISKELSRLESDDRFIRKKKVFSQNKRPPKITRTPPVNIFFSSENRIEAADEIRANGSIIETIVQTNTDKWYKEDVLPLRFGSNYHVNEDDFPKTLLRTISKKRLTIPERFLTDFSPVLEGNDFSLNETELHIAALSLSVWYCERVRQIKRY